MTRSLQSKLSLSMLDRGRIKENFKLKGPNIKTKSHLVPRKTALISFPENRLNVLLRFSGISD